MRNDVSSVRPSDIIIKSTTVSIIYLPIRPSSPSLWRKREEFSDIGTELKKSSDQVVSIYAAVYTFIIIPLSNVTNVLFIQITPPRVILPQNLLLDDPTYDQPCVIYFEGSQRFLLSRSLCNLCYSIKRQRLSFLSVFFPLFVTIARQLQKFPLPLSS